MLHAMKLKLTDSKSITNYVIIYRGWVETVREGYRTGEPIAWGEISEKGISDRNYWGNYSSAIYDKEQHELYGIH